MIFFVSSLLEDNRIAIAKYLANFGTQGVVFGNGDRNVIKLFDFKGQTINVKSFKIPNLINKVAYKYFRKSKAKRSFEYANNLLDMGIGTPKPLAYLENFNWLGLKDSYYASEHLQAELTYRELVEIPDYPDHDNILRQFTSFTFKLHEKGVEFLDHSPGNTLIKKEDNDLYSFYLVDLNRMNFHNQMTFEQRMKNCSRLTPKKDMIAIMSNEYSKYYIEKTEEEIFERMWFETQEFQDKFAKKRRLKKRLKFWKS